MRSSLYIHRLLRFSPRDVPGFLLNRLPLGRPRPRLWRRLALAARGRKALRFSAVDRINSSSVYARMQAAAQPLTAPFTNMERVATAGLALTMGMMAAIFALHSGHGPVDRAALEKNSRLSAERPAPDSAAGEQLAARFDSLHYVLPAVLAGDSDVPRIYLANLPPNMAGMTTVGRKDLFIRALLPLVLRRNEAILADRRRLIRLSDQAAAGVPLGAADAGWMASLAEAYGVGSGDAAALLERVDAVPPSLALAQGAEESGWGTSRFAVLGNALFGQWTNVKGTGIVPEGRDSGASHEIRAFDALEGSVAGYMRNLNTHAAYRELRAARAAMRRTGGPLDGMTLAATLTRYSQRREAYVESLRSIMRANNLSALDAAGLHPALTAELE